MMKPSIPVGLLALTMAAACGAPAGDDVDPEPTGSVEQSVAVPYRIAVLQISQASNATLNTGSFGTFGTDFSRIMQNKIYAAMDFYGPYHATPAQIGCNGNSNHDNPLIESKALAMAQAAGVVLGQYRHIWFIKNNDLLPGCAIGGASGGHWFASPGYGVNSRVGYVTNFATNVVAMHEFEHGFYGPSLNPHLGVVTCSGGILRMDSPTCTFNTGGGPDGAPQTVWALGTKGPPIGSPTLHDENPVYKVFWSQYGLIPFANLTPIPQTVGSHTYTLHPSDGPIPPAGNWMTVYLPLPSLFGSPTRTRALWFDYRQHAQIGLAGEDRPGIYVYYQEDFNVTVPQGTTTQPAAHVVRLFTNSSNQSGLGPIPITLTYVVPGEPNVSVQAPTSCGATCQVRVNVNGPLQ